METNKDSLLPKNYIPINYNFPLAYLVSKNYVIPENMKCNYLNWDNEDLIFIRKELNDTAIRSLFV